MKPMDVLVGCECSGIIRDEFIKRGHNAWSCDLKPSETDGPHLLGDVRHFLKRHWDLFIVHPDCTYLTVSNNGPMANGCGKYTKEEGQVFRQWGIDFFMEMANTDIEKTCAENPIGIMSTEYRKPDQIIQPYEYGHDASKKTCLWLKGLPKLTPTLYVPPRMVNGLPRWANQTDSGQNRLTPNENRAADRARTYKGIAEAMASQWSENLKI